MSEQRFYLVLVEDHDFETLAYLFSNKQAATNKARKIAQTFSAETHFYEECDYTETSDRIEFPPGEWLFYAEYSKIGDCVRVVPIILDANIH